MLVKGNSKIGRSIWVWSIPAGSTCPGKTEVCDSRCYAQRGFYVMPNVKRSHERNYEASQMDDFAERMIEEIQKKRCGVIRIHSSGDFYSAAYVRKWHEIVKASPNTRFFTYTRSWRIPQIEPAIRDYVKDCPNLKMWYSIDHQTGYPRHIPKRVRTAYMAISAYDIPDNKKTDLTFRDYGIRGVTQKFLNGVLVCPPENGVSDLTCEKCGICWSRETALPKRPAEQKRIPLQLAA